MGRGALIKRIDSLDWDCPEAYPGMNANMYCLQGFQSTQGIEDIIEEAKKEWPSSGFGDSTENAAIDAIHKIERWFAKWFGERDG